MLKPISHTQWTEIHRTHLLKRAGFGKAPLTGSPGKKATPEAWVDRLLDTPAEIDPVDIPSWTKEPTSTEAELKKIRKLPENERRLKRREKQRKMRQHNASLRSWWLTRMLKGQEPLQEKMTLFWHGHFVSSTEKVRRPELHWQQNQLLRYQGMGSFRDLTVSIGRDPAMLAYLDGNRSRKKSPNENYARELMELFTLGEGHYTEEDIKEAARAFTGWVNRPARRKSTFVKSHFDAEEKEFFGEKGNFNDKDIVNIILKQEQTAKYISKKLWEYFAYYNPEPEIIQSLASTFRKNDYQIKPLLREIFLSEAFYSKKNIGTQIKSPVMWLASLARVLDVEPFPTQIGTQVLARLGQDLLNPPSVKGWDGGRAWVSTSTLILRNNLAHFLINGGKPNSVGLSARDTKNIPAEVLEAMTSQQKNRLQKKKNRAQHMKFPSFLRNQSLSNRWNTTAEKNRLPLLIKEVFQGPIRSTSLQELETNPNIMLSSGDTEKILKNNIYELIAHPEFQLT